MWTLAFDTTTTFCSIALFDNHFKKDSYSQEMAFGQSEALMLNIQKMLESNHLTIQDLGLTAVCTGPGSFTGVRSSIAAARAFALANKHMALCGVTAFDAYLHALPTQPHADNIAVLIETKREDYYVAYYNNDLSLLQAPKTAFFEDIVHDLQNKQVILIGDAVQRFLSKEPPLKIDTSLCETHPNPDQIALIALSRLEQKQNDFPIPLYLKGADICAK